MRKILTYIFALSCVLGLTACNNSTKPEPQKEIQSQSDTSQNTLVVYFSMPETTNSENMTEEEDNSTVVIDGEVMGNTQYVAMEIQEKMNADIFRIEPETSYTTNHAVPNSVSRDAMEDEYELEIVSAPSAEDIMMAVENTKDTINTFVELVSRVIEKSPKIGYAVLLLHTGVKGAEFYDKMRLSSFPGNRVRQEAEEILKGGLANFDVESYKGYKSKFNDIYREEAYALLNVIIEMLG